MTDLTPDRLAELRALADAATEGPWWGGGNNRRRDAIGLVGRTSDRGTGNAIAVLNGIGMDRTADATSQNFSTRATFIAAARTAVPELLDEIERLHYLLSESQTDLDNEREFRDADDQIAEMRADVIREAARIRAALAGEQ